MWLFPVVSKSFAKEGTVQNYKNIFLVAHHPKLTLGDTPVFQNKFRKADFPLGKEHLLRV